MKKILIILTELYNPQYKGGIQVFNSFLVKALLEIGYELRIVSSNDREEDIKEDFIFPCNDGKRRKILTAWNTIKQTISFKPDLLLCGHVNFSPLCMMISRIFKIPYIVLTYGVDVWNLNGMNIMGLKHAQGIVTISKHTKRVMLEQLNNYPEDKIFMLYPSFDPEKFKPKPKPEYLMNRWNINEDDKIILTIARISKSEKYKGYDKVIMALKDVLKEIPDVKYILGGSGDDLERIKNLINENGLNDKVILPGFIPDEELVDYCNLCDLFVMPSKKEGFGIVFLEALACGKPVIAGNKDGSVNAVLDGEVGILVDPDNLDGIKGAIIKVLKGEVDKRLLDGEYLRKRVLEEYGFDRFRERVRELIEKVAL